MARAQETAPNGSPWYVRAFVTVGLPTALVVVGLGIWTGYVPSPLAKEDTLKQHVQQAGDLAVPIKANHRVLLQICRNTAKNDTQRDACDE